jgi:DNA-binding PucR family transcriptional regulator
MSDIVCQTKFQNKKEKIREVFSTSFILACASINSLPIYDDIFADEKIKKVLNNEDIIHTAKIFLENDLNLSKASKQWFLHRNTMIYRIGKIEQITGLNIRKFNDAVLFSNMMEIHKRFI